MSWFIHGGSTGAMLVDPPSTPGGNMQRHIELIVGRLLTDEAFRRAFQLDPQQALADAEMDGLLLTPYEVAALLATDRSLWERMARELSHTVIGPASSADSS